MDSDFYIFLRLYIFCISSYFTFLKYKDKNLNFVFLFIVIAIAITFNPFFPLRFSDEFQNVIEFFTAVFFGYLTYKEYKWLVNEKNQSKPANIFRSAWKKLYNEEPPDKLVDFVIKNEAEITKHLKDN